MLRLAIEHYPGLGIDERELRRPPPSYTIDSLREMRCELGNDVSLVWVIGADTLESLALWKNWQQLPELAHLLIVDRPGAHWPTRGAVHEWLRTLPSVQSPNQLQCRPAGLLLRLALPPLPCSSTAIRTALTERRPDSPRPAGLPACVWRYILEHHLYQSDSGHEAQ
jgi:nicotinate-nucleotide adenylyltransferase